MSYRDNYKLIDWSKPIEIERKHYTPVSLSDLPCPMIISDTLHDVVNPLDGKPYDSKASYYRTVRENDCQILGNETITPRDNDDIPIAPIEAEVAKAFDQLS